MQGLEADASGTALGQLLDAVPSAARGRPSGADTVPGRGSAFGRDDNAASALDAFLGVGADPLGNAAAAPMSDQAQGLFRQQDVNMAMPAQGNNTVPGSARVPDAFDDDIFSTLDLDFGAPRVVATPAPVPVVAPRAPAPAIDPLDMDLLTGVPLPPARTQAVAAPLPAQAAALPVAASVATVTRGAVDAGEALAVLAQALELEPGDLDSAHPLETIRIVGELLNLTVNGLYQMLEMRAQLKNELRIEDRTMPSTTSARTRWR
jgi:predicted component of type VI protein secretion system